MKLYFYKQYQIHYNFILLLILFITFRVLTLVAYRPGGLVLDFSDFYWYREFAQLSRQGYIPYNTMWPNYPPLFSVVMLNVWHVSTLLPPWGNYNNLWFSLLLGGTFLFFEVGNFCLLYLMALKLYGSKQAIKPSWIYATLFVPVYTLTGWFESYPLFFFLLSLYLLLQHKPYLSAFFSGVGFMVKLIPIILLPIGVKLLSINGELKPKGLRLQLKKLNINFNLKQVALYISIFILTIIAIGYPFYRMNPDLILATLKVSNFRLPWETVWALLVGNYAYGIVPFDMRDLTWQATTPPANLPWLWITVIFGIVYAFLYTRYVNWQQPKVATAFTGLTVCLFFLYSKGYSPQWLGWLLFFNALLLPNIRGIIYASLLSIANIVEANIFFIMFPEEKWLLASTILLRTGLIVVLALEFALIIWPHLNSPKVVKVRQKALILGLIGLILALIPATNQLTKVYFENRLNQSQYKNSITWLQEQAVTEAILLNNQNTYDWFYPYLRHSHAFFMLDDYADASTTVKAKTLSLLNQIANKHQALWIYDADPSETTPAESVAFEWLQNKQLAHQADIDGGRLYLYILK